MRLFRLTTLIILLLLTSQVFAQSSLEERGYGIYVPTTYDEDEPMPFLIALHGFGDTWENFSKASGLIQGAENFGYIAVFPNGYLRQWNDGSQGDHYEDDVAILLELIEVMSGYYNIDSERIYLVGFSNGGTMVYRAACEAPHVFAGIAAIGGTMRKAQDCEEEAALPVLIIHGTGDTTVPFDGGNGRYSIPETTNFWTDLNACDTSEIPEYDPERFRNHVAAYYYEQCDNANQVVMYVIENYPHTWPGATAYIRNQMPDTRVNAVLIIWAFFERTYEAKSALLETEEVVESGD